MGIFDRNLDGKTKVDMAIDRIRSFCKGKKVLVAFSGGKDSQCCYHLAKAAGIDFSAQYSVTRFEPPELISFIRDNYKDVVFRRAYTRSLVDEVAYRGLPNRWARWCCAAKHEKTDGFDIAVIGIRAEESARRAANWRMFGQKKDRTYYVCPIIDWTTSDVWDYLAYVKAPHCKLYDEGYRRIGCVCCPLAPTKMAKDAARWPKVANALKLGNAKFYAACEAKKVTKSGKPWRILEHGSADVAFDYWLNTGCSVTTKDHQPTDEPCLFAGTGFSESDNAK